MTAKPQAMPGTDFPRAIGDPAFAALTAAGYTALDQLAGVPKGDIQALHGVGPKAVRVLEAALAERGLAFGD